MQSELITIESKEKTGDSSCGCGSGGCGCHSGNQHGGGQSGLPDRFQLLQEGDTVVEFGSGLGKDCFSAAGIVGKEGRVIGIDISAENIAKAKSAAELLEFTNLEFLSGSVDAAPVPDECADVIYATCVFNLQQDKQKVADEMYRVVKHNGYVCVSDFVTLEDMPEGLKEEAAGFAGSIGGAEKVNVFMDYFRRTGFTQGGIVEVNKVKLPDEMLAKYLDPAMIARYNDINADEGVFSVVLVVEKPETCTAETCCHNPDKHKN